MKKIAILGATGHIAKSLIDGFCRTNKYELILFARSLDRLRGFLANIPFNNASSSLFDEFDQAEYDVIINCAGIGDPAKLKKAGVSIFRLTEKFDNMILDYLEEFKDTLYINFSSGAVYGTRFENPVKESSSIELFMNNITPIDFYGIAKLNAEAKHRAMPGFNIVDLRVFGYFSRFIDLNSHYFMSEVLSSVTNGKVLVTGKVNIIRDYVHPQDIISLIEKCIAKQAFNGVFDVYSKKPVTKFEILEYFANKYNLMYTIREDIDHQSITGIKDHYYSNFKKAEKLGYAPKFTSMESIIEESKFILNDMQVEKWKIL